MEYLMTYGWAILIIAVVLAVLFQLGVFSGGNLGNHATAGSCLVQKTAVGSSLVGECNGMLPEFVGKFSNTINSEIYLKYIPLNDRSFTISAWIKSPDFAESPTLDLGIFGQGCTGGPCPNPVTDNALHFVVRSDTLYMGFYSDDLGSPDLLGDNTWYFATFEYNLAANSKTIFLDGVQDNTGASTSPFNLVNSSSGSYAVATCIGSETSCTTTFNGSIANVQLYNTSLSAPEVLALYQEGIGGAPIRPQNIVGWWPLNGNAQDYSGNGYNGNAVSVTYSSSWQSGYTAP